MNTYGGIVFFVYACYQVKAFISSFFLLAIEGLLYSQDPGFGVRYDKLEFFYEKLHKSTSAIFKYRALEGAHAMRDPEAYAYI